MSSIFMELIGFSVLKPMSRFLVIASRPYTLYHKVYDMSSA